MSPEEQQVAADKTRTAIAARRLIGNRDFQTVWAWLKDDFGIGTPSLLPDDLKSPLDGFSKALISQRNDGQVDVFNALDRLAAFRPVTEHNEEHVNTEDDEHSTSG